MGGPQNVAKLQKVGRAGRRVLLFLYGYPCAKRVLESANEMILIKIWFDKYHAGNAFWKSGDFEVIDVKT